MNRLASTEEQLDALPNRAVIRCDDIEEIGMNVAERHENGWVFIGHPEPFTSKQLSSDRVTFEVLWAPDAEG